MIDLDDVNDLLSCLSEMPGQHRGKSSGDYRKIVRRLVGQARRCPGCGIRMTPVAWQETVPPHPLPSKARRLTGDFWCPAEGLRLVAVRPFEWEPRT